MSGNKFSKRFAMLSAVICLAISQTAFAGEKVDMNLQQAMERAFNTNAAITMAEYDVKSAKASYDAARQSRLISINGSHQTQRSGSNHDQYMEIGGVPVNVGKNVGNSNTNTISASMPIYTGGQSKGRIKQAKASYNISKIDQQKAYNDMRTTVTNGYFQVLQTDNIQKLYQESVGRLADHLKNVKAQYDVGVVAKVDVLRSEVELVNMQQNLIQAKNNYDLAVASLDRVVGLPMDTELNLDNIMVYTPYDKDMAYCLDYASKNRPDLEIARQSVEAAKGSLLVARSGYQPKITASASQNWNKDHGWGTDARGWGAGVGISMNIFDSGVTFSQIHGAKAELAKAQERYRDTVDAINLDVRQNYLNLRESEKRISTTETAVAQAEEDYRIAKLRYMNGVGTNTDVLDAQVALTQAKNNYLKALYDYNTNKAQLESAIGVPMEKPIKIVVEPKSEKVTE